VTSDEIVVSESDWDSNVVVSVVVSVVDSVVVVVASVVVVVSAVEVVVSSVVEVVVSAVVVVLSLDLPVSHPANKVTTARTASANANTRSFLTLLLLSELSAAFLQT
jgi:hypothetical protein